MIGVPVPREGADLSSECLAAGREECPEEYLEALTLGPVPGPEQDRGLVEERLRDLPEAMGDEGCVGEVGSREEREDLVEHLARDMVQGGHSWWPKNRGMENDEECVDAGVH